jgi:DNA-binding response OmpR family regulator
VSATLAGKRILVVDDEPDVGALVKVLLPKVRIELAHTYDDAREKLLHGSFDAVVLDIMGVDGYRLLDELALRCPCIMLTAHALSPQDLKKSMDFKAALYLPKDQLAHLEESLLKIFEAVDRQSLWRWVVERNWVSFAPGEIRSCPACHGINRQTQSGQAVPQNVPDALRVLLREWRAQYP